METGSETAMKTSSSSASKNIVTTTSLLSSSSMLKQSSMSCDQSGSVESEASSKSSQLSCESSLPNKLTIMTLIDNDDDGYHHHDINVPTTTLEVVCGPGGGVEFDVASSASSTSMSSVSSVMKKASSVSASSTTSTSLISDVISVERAPAPKNEAKTTGVPALTRDQPKQDNVNSTIKEIISDIDNNIKEQENITILKQQEQELLKKQEMLAQQIKQQQLLAQQLAAENKHQQLLQKQQQQQSTQTYQHQPQKQNISKYEETQDENNYRSKIESYETSEESSNVSKRIDLQKIFTPATDAEEILPRNRKLYASSAFYTPGLHPTVEDQVELARRISHSLSDISNKTSKGQSMYVNRKKRSVKWVHEGCGQDASAQHDPDYEEECKENDDLYNDKATPQLLDKLPLRLLMNPRGQIRDYNSVRESFNVESGLLSPDKCAELVSALQAQKGRGAELFAKRRKKADKWVVDESNAGTQSPSGLPDYHQYQPRPPTSPRMVPAYSDAGKHRVQLNMHQEQLLEKYAKPGLNMVKTPWEAALETGSASTAFIEKQTSQLPQLSSNTPTLSPAPTPQYDNMHRYSSKSPTSCVSNTTGDFGNGDYAPHVQKMNYQHQPPSATKSTVISGNRQRDLAYKPSVAQGWKAPSLTLPKELYVPKEIPLESYAPPPTPCTKAVFGSKNITPTWQPSEYQQYTQPIGYSTIAPQRPTSTDNSVFPLNKPSSGGFGPYSNATKQLQGPTTYQKVPQSINQTVPQVNFNPSPLPYDKLAKFEQPNPESVSPTQIPRHLAVYGGQVRNTSPIPFGGQAIIQAQQKRYSTPYDAWNSNRGTPISTASPRLPSQQFVSHSIGADIGYEFGGSSIKDSSTSRIGGDILNYHQPSQNFNTSARGWSTGSSSGQYNQQHTQMKPEIVSGHLPYTDF